MDFTLDIAAPVSRVFEVIADLPAYGSWLSPSGLYAGSTVPSETPLRLGTTYTDHARGATLDGRVTLFEPPQRISFSQHSQQPLGRLSVDITYELEAKGEATRLHRT